MLGHRLGGGARARARRGALSRSPFGRRSRVRARQPRHGRARRVRSGRGDRSRTRSRDLAAKLDADLVVVGPEDPLVAGVVDAVEASGRLAFGPRAAAARLEGSKAWMKDVLVAAGVPTARHSAFVAGEDERGVRVSRQRSPGLVRHQDRRTRGGQGRRRHRIGRSTRATRCARTVGRRVRRRGPHVVIEEGLAGPELSVFALCDGRSAALVGVAQDHKRAFDGDEGPNTGGMGAYSPVPFFGDRRRRKR